MATYAHQEYKKWRQFRATIDAHLPFRDFVYRTSNEIGASFYVQASGKPIFDASGKFLGYRGGAADVSSAVRAKQAEQELRKVKAELAHVTRVTTLGELTASIARTSRQ